MDKVFVSSSFHDPDRDLVNQVSSIIAAFGAQPVAGRRLGGEQLEAAVQAKIESCDGVVALFTKRNEGDGYKTHPWVIAEVSHAHAKNIPALAVLEKGIQWGQLPFPGRAYIGFDRARPMQTLLTLMEELGDWKRNDGLDLIATVTTPDVVRFYLEDPGRLKVRYRTIYRAKRDEDWRGTDRIYRDGEALAVALPKILTAEHLVEMEVTWGNKKWLSSAIRQSVPVQLTQVA